MRQSGLDLVGAIKSATAYHDELKTKFLEQLPKIPSFGPKVDNELSEHVFQLANAIRANVCWSFEGKRYFGDRGLEIQKKRWVELLPKKSTT